MDHEEGRASLSQSDSAPDRVGLWPTELRHPVEDVARESGPDLGISSTRPHAVEEDRLVSKECVLGAGLSMVTGVLLPLPSTDLADPANGSISN